MKRVGYLRRLPWERWLIVDGHPAIYSGADYLDADERIVSTYTLFRSAEAHARVWGGRVVWHQQWKWDDD